MRACWCGGHSSWSLLLLLLLCLANALADVTDCRYTFAGGQTFELSALSKTSGEIDWSADDRNGNMYYFNVCSDANQVPAACVSVEKAVQAPAYQVSRDNDCFWLGKLQSEQWELIDESEPAAGIELYYFDGEQCSNGMSRDFRIQLFCDPDAGVGKPLDYFVLEEDCHYSVTWPSKYGCPVGNGVFAAGSFAWISYALLALAVYLSAGLAYNVTRKGMAFDPEAIPHVEVWRSLFATLLGLLVAAKTAVQELASRRGATHQPIDSDGPYDRY